MPIASQNISMIRDPDFQKCGEIMVAPKRNTFAMSCLYCEDIFTSLPAFMRHLHQRHKEELQFEDKDAAVEVYAVEELVNRTMCGVEDSEESGVADDDFNLSEYDEHNEEIKNLNEKGKMKVDGKERSTARDVVKKATLGNLSILNALEDCDVSLNFVENLNDTIIGDKQENECQENDVEIDEELDEEEDIDMDSTIVKRIQMDLGLENDENQAEIRKEGITKGSAVMDLKEYYEKNDDSNSSAEDDDQNVTLTNGNIGTSINTLPNSERVTGLKNLLCGLDDLGDIDDLLNNIEDSSVSKYQGDLREENQNKSHETLQQTAPPNDVELNEFSLDASILKQCLADDDVENVKEIVEKHKNISKNDKNDKTENGNMSVLQLQVMADWDLDDIDLEDCLNCSSFESRDAVKINEVAKNDNILQRTPTSSQKCKDVVEKPRTPKTKSMDLECKTKSMDLECIVVASKENTNLANAGNEQLNTPESTQFNNITPKSSKISKNNKTTLNSQKTPKTQNKSFSKQRTEALEENALDTLNVDETHSTEEDSRNTKAVANSPKSIQKTPKFSNTMKNCDQITPKIRKSVPVKNTPKEVLGKNEAVIRYMEKELTENNSYNQNIGGKDTEITPKARKAENRIKPANRTAEDEKELETNKFEEGLSEDNSSTHMYDEYTESSEKSKGYSLHSLLNKSINDEQDLDTLINQIEGNSDESIKDRNGITTAKETDTVLNQYTLEHHEEASLEDEMEIFRKFIGLNSDRTIEKDEHFKANEEQDVDDFDNLLNDDLSKALEKALEEDNIDMSFILNAGQPDLETHEQNKISVPVQRERVKSPNKIKTSSKISPKVSAAEDFKGKYTKTNQKARQIQGSTIKCLENALKHSNHNVLTPKLCNKKQASDLQTPQILKRTLKENQDALLPKKLHNFPNFRKTPKSYLGTDAHLIKINKSEIVTPSRFYVNTQRGDRSPMKFQDLFLKQSPKTQEETGEKPGNTPNQITPDNKTYKKSPSECKKDLTKMTTPVTRKTPRAKTISPQNRVTEKQLVAKSSDSLRPILSTPQKVRQLSIKLQRCTSHLNLNKSSESLTISEEIKSPSTKQQIPTNEKSPLSAQEREHLSSVFKLPNGITISKVNSNTSPTIVDVTPIRSTYCKQNFTEQQLVVGFQDSMSNESLIKSLPATVTITKTKVSLASRLRARQASIDIVSSAKSPKKCSLDYKSYAVNRSARKKEVLHRMRTIKKQIFKSIQSNSLNNSKIVKSPIPRKRKRSTIQIENVQILPNVKSEVLTPLLSAQHLSPQLSSVQDVGEQTTPKSVMDDNNLQSKSCINLIEEPPTETTPNQNKVAGKSPEMTSKQNNGGKSPETTPKHIEKDKSSKSTNMHIKASKSCETTPKSIKKAKSTEPSPKQSIVENDIESTPPKTSMQAVKTPSTGRRGRPVKRQADSPLEEECSKRVCKSPNKQQQICTEASELEATQLGLSESVADILQGDVKTNNLKVDSILNEPMPVDDITPEQAPQKSPEKKDSPKLEDSKTDGNKPRLNTSDSNILDDILKQVSSSKCTVQDYDDPKDLELLGIVGLKIIIDKDVEDLYNIEEVDEIRAKAQQFADICKQCSRLFSHSKLSNPVMLLKNMNASLNKIFNVNLSINDIKRLVNLVITWYTNCFNNKLIEKNPISETTNYYLQILNFIPKTSKRSYYCEFCDDQFNTEHKYYTHRIQHTGAHYPYSCKYCPVGFVRLQPLKSHYLICKKRPEQREKQLRGANKTQQIVHKAEDHDNNILSLTNAVNGGKKIVKAENVSGGPVQRRLQTVYKCAKCEMSFISESAVKLHLYSCKRNQRRQPKNCTPRPKPKGEPYSKN